MTIKLLLADVDGTLVTRDKSLTAHTREAVARLRAAGVELMITSGRPPHGMARYVAALDIETPVAAFNGALYVRPDLKTIMAQRTLTADTARPLVGQLLKAGLDVWIYQGDDWFLRRRDAPHVEREMGNVGIEPTVVPDLEAVLANPLKIVGVSDDRSLMALAEAELAALCGTGAVAARSQPYYLDVTHPEANKGMVAREASRFLQIPLQHIASIGDMPNDVPMLVTAGLGIAMGNASPDVQRIARHVTTTNEDEGFAKAVESFVLGEPPLARTPLGLPPRAKACLFGLDGVLAQTGRIHAEAWKRLYDPYLHERARASGQPFVPFDSLRDFAAHFDARPPAEAVRSFLDSRGIELPEKTVRALVERKGEIMRELMSQEHIEPYEGSLRFLRAARAAGLRTAVVSSSRHCREALCAAGMEDLFDARVDGAVARAQHLARKPSPDTYLAAAYALDVLSEEAVVFENEGPGVEAGKAGHFAYVVGVDRGGHAAELRQRGADVVVPDLAALLEPTPLAA